MNSAIRLKLKQAITGVALFCTVVQPTLAAAPAGTNRIELASEPLFLGTTVIPKVMLTISKDQQLFKKAYNDYSDLDGDGVIETTYKHSIPYYGYFDSRKCYVYSTANGRFEPSVDNSNADDTHGLCAAGTAWHGNFLNWLSMTRMDAIRKLLYGGTRSFDGTTTALGTVLERAYIPPDAHAWAKYYNPAAPGSTAAEQPAIDRLTPFSPSTTADTSTNQTINSVRLPNTTTDVAMSITAGLATNPNATVGIKDPIFNISSAPAGVSLGDQLRISKATGSVTGAVKAISGNNYTLSVNPASIIGTGTGSGSWTVTNLSSTGISFCNMTPGTSGDDTKSQTNTQPPQIRVVRGNYALWSSNERFQCLWRHERSALLGGFDTQPGSNGNHAVLSGIDASAENPDRTTHALSTVASVNGEYIARVQVCVSAALIVGEKCKNYGAAPAVLKPFGLLQQYGDDDRIHFGLTTGSFTSNTNGGVLRKNVKSFTDEVNGSNGTFSNANHYRPPAAPRSQGTTPLTAEGIVNTLNYMRIYGYNYGSNYNEGTYLGSSGDDCGFQLTDITPGTCTSWGNPMAEVFFDSLRYFANQPPVSELPDSSKDNVLGLPNIKGIGVRLDPMANTLYCAKLNVLVFNASVSTNEEDLRAVTVSSINGGGGASSTIATLTTNVGNNEGITATTPRSSFVGQIGVTPSGSDFQLCTAKAVTDLGNVFGICPEGPTLSGSYFIGGLAHHAKTTRIRTPGSLPLTPPTVPASDTTSLKVTSYGIQLATNTPELVIPVPGLAGRRVVIQPIYRLDTGGTSFGGGALVDMKFVSQTSDATTGIATGKVYVNWEDSEQGGDYDQDMWGTISWVLNRNANTMTVTTHAISSSTGGARQGFGFTISGTTQDGPHFFSGLIGFNFTDTVTAQPANFAGCSNCRADSDGAAGQKGAQTATFTLSATSAGESLKDPLWYLAKYGGFNDLDDNGKPGAAAEWDTTLVDGTTGADGVPDNYFLVTNPLGLEAALTAAFDAVTRNATATSVAANTTSLQVGSTIYAARFDPKDWSGNLEALPINADGSLGTALWNAQQQLSAVTPGSRDIYTFNDTSPAIDAANGRRGTRFQWTSASGLVIPPSLETYLNTSPSTGTTDNRGSQRLAYLRGNRAQETGNLKFRKRNINGPLGDIINSNPVLVTEPRANIFDTNYITFKNTPAIKNRTHMVYVAANDGMLHGFDANTGRELLAYVPSKTFPHLNKLTNPAYVHRSYVDGSPEVADACVGPAGGCTWKSVLVGALGAGGQGLYALDVSDPVTFGTANAASSTLAQSLVMWEFNDTDDADLGFITSQPVIRKMADGRWAAIVSGGYNNTDSDGAVSATGNGVLFIIFLSGPTGANRSWSIANGDYIKIDTGRGVAQAPASPPAMRANQPNGLSRPLAADTDADGAVNFIYAGDLQGNLWKFDVSSSDRTLWTQATRQVLLFTAVHPTDGIQPITAPVEGALHPGGKGFIISFGTGKYLEPRDTEPPRFKIQSYYGIWDKNDGLPVPPLVPLINSQTRLTAGSAGRDQLLRQVLSDTVVSGRRVRTIQLDPITGRPKVPDWSSLLPPVVPPVASDSPTKHMGWFMDFPNATEGERVVFTPLLRGGRLIFTTVIPSTDACQFGGSSFLMVIDPASGGPFEAAVIDINGDGLLNTTDRTATLQYVSGLQSETGVGITNTPRIVTRPPDPGFGGSPSNILGTSDPRTGTGVRSAYAILAGSSGTIVSPTIALLNQSPRISWREVLRD